MPYELVKRGDKWCVQKSEGDRRTMGCHDSKDKAYRQMAALYAAENKE